MYQDFSRENTSYIVPPPNQMHLAYIAEKLLAGAASHHGEFHLELLKSSTWYLPIMNRV